MQIVPDPVSRCRRLLCLGGLVLAFFGTLHGVACSQQALWVDLGLAEYPLVTSARPAGEPIVQYRWIERSLTPPEHRLGVRIHSGERLRIQSEVERLRRVTRFESVAGGFRWDPKQECGLSAGNRDTDSRWQCIYDRMATPSLPAISVVMSRFLGQIDQRAMSREQAAALVISFVQDIPYAALEDQLFGVLPPVLVIHERRGDCDSKSLLAHIMLAAIGVESHLMISEAHRHVMLAVNLRGNGAERRIGGQRYLMTEMTARHPVGRIPTEVASPDDWRAVQVVSPRSGRQTGSSRPELPALDAQQVRQLIETNIVGALSWLLQRVSGGTR